MLSIPKNPIKWLWHDDCINIIVTNEIINKEIDMEDALKKIGKEWKRNGHHRIYFNAVKFAELTITRYNTNYYSNKNFAVWYNCNTEKFEYRADGVEDDAIKIGRAHV